MKSHNIKDLLEERTIEVSENSWEKLASQLDANDQKKKRKSFYPYAACLALLVSFIVFMMLKKDVGSQENSIVNTEKTIKLDTETTTPSPIILKEEVSDELFKETLVVSEESIQPKKVKIVVKTQKEETSISNQQKEQLEVALQKEVQNAVAVNKNKGIPKVIETISTQKEVVVDPNKELRASIVALSATENIAITDEEIDQLLKEAQESLSEIDVKKEQDLTRFATADELLNEVEHELDKSFKQRVFDLIKKNVKKGKTLLADRN